ncbi:ABC transporter substrate-binding protein [Pseudomonadota bacterium]
MEHPRSPIFRSALTLGAVFVVAVLAIGGYRMMNQVDSGLSYQGPKESISIGAGQGAFLVWIADEQGYFDEAGLNADVRLFKTGKAAANGMSKGEVNVATAASFVLVKKGGQESDLRVLASIKRGYTIRFIARVDHGIKEPSDLKNKKVGVTRGSAGEYFLGRFLTFNELELSDVEIVDMPPKVMAEAVINGEIDAAFSWEPHIYRAKNELGDNAVVFIGQGKQEFYFLLLAKDAWVQAHPVAAERLLRALVQAQNFTRDNPDKAGAIIAKKFEYDPVYLEYVWQLQDDLVELPQSLITFLEDQTRWAVNNDIIQGDEYPNYMDFLYLKGLEAAEPSAVTVIR